MLSLEEQRASVQEIIAIAARLEANGDPYLEAQYMHLKERAEALRSILEVEAEVLSAT
jgi:hypothetical protein